MFRPLRKKRRTRSKQEARQALLEQLPRGAVCAEIGVWKGDFSAAICEATAPAELHLIDPWTFQPEFPERMYGGSVAQGQADMDRIYEGVRERFAGRGNVTVHRGTSAEVLPRFPDGFFDWVYVDGNHYYEYVLEDLRLCRAKVKAGGIIAGDDYYWGRKEGQPVQRAVQDFLAEIGTPHPLELFRAQFLIRL